MKAHLVFGALVWCLVLVAAGNGLLDRTPGEQREYVTVRGERAIIHGRGLYSLDPEVLAVEGMVWDAVNIAWGLPLLALAVIAAWKGSLRGRLLLAGLFFYFFYTYLQLLTVYAFNRMFLVYVAIVALSGPGIFLSLSTIDVPRLPQRVGARFPRGLFIGFVLAASAALVAMWTARIVQISSTGRFPPELAGLITLTTQGFDLGLIVPLALASGILLLRKSSWGYVCTGVLLSFVLVMSLTLPAWIVFPLVKQGTLRPLEALPFAAISLVGLGLAVLFFAHLRER
ncbi:MAG: hypothetical protein ONB17_05265 [candidate division KSB1 bacterium]|nr:hypothetical protein [candidate division KSB1 bacterium]MDZ7378251.1 hypothetical protein [candidate division KSB1 bacterium]